MFPILFHRIRKSLFVVLPLLIVAGYAVQDALSHYRGVAYCAVPLQQNPGCNATATGGDPCHGPNPSSSTVIHVFMPSVIYAGSTDTIRISVANKSNLDVAAGFDVDIDTPAMLNTTSNTTTVLWDNLPPFPSWSDIHQTVPQLFSANGPNSDSAVWSIIYTARPTAGYDTLYIDGNAVDGDSASATIHDHWDSLTQIITVLPAPSGVAQTRSANSVRVYPNPASNEVFIDDGNPADIGSYTLTDAAGRVVRYGRQIVLDGSRSIDLSMLATGAYVLNVQPRMGHAFTRSISIEH